MESRVWRSTKQYAVQRAVRALLAALARDVDRNAVLLATLAERVAGAEHSRRQLRWVRERFAEGHPCLTLANRVLHEAHPNCRRRLVENLFVNNTWLGDRQRQDVEARYGLRPPHLLVISPTMRCNLRCYGCYAGAYDQKDDLPFDTWNRIITEGKALGIYFYTISGGEPFFRRDLFDIAERHSDCYFQVYTNGVLLDEAVVTRIVECGNLSPSISIEGFEQATDERRGTGIWRKINAAMDELRRQGAIYGFSGTVTSQNADVMASRELMDWLVAKGCYYGWFFTYIPIGREPALELMPTPQQRNRLREWTLQVRRTYPIFAADFWNDGPLVGCCMAGGRLYAHINHQGDVEPCVFTHFAVDNVKEKPLAECLGSAFFRDIRSRQPYDENPLRPCMIIDNPHVLREVVEIGRAHV